jgi:hypothetical protein
MDPVRAVMVIVFPAVMLLLQTVQMHLPASTMMSLPAETLAIETFWVGPVASRETLPVALAELPAAIEMFPVRAVRLTLADVTLPAVMDARLPMQTLFPV